MKPEIYVSCSQRSQGRRVIFRVAVKQFSGNLNTLDRTLAESTFRTQKAAEKYAAEMARSFRADRVLPF